MPKNFPATAWTKLKICCIFFLRLCPPEPKNVTLESFGVRLTYVAATRGAVRSSGRHYILGTRPNPRPPLHHNARPINTVQSHSNRRTRNWLQNRRRERRTPLAVLDTMNRLRVWRLVVRRDPSRRVK